MIEDDGGCEKMIEEIILFHLLSLLSPSSLPPLSFSIIHHPSSIIMF
jgi:hypothetical protein